MRRALLQRGDKARFDDLWNKAEFHVPAAEKAKHPLPITSILLTMNLEQEKAIHRLDEKIVDQDHRIRQLEAERQARGMETILLKGEVEGLRWEIEDLRKRLREELLELLYPNYA